MISKGIESAYRLVVERRLQLISSRPLLVELVRVLIQKFGWQPIRAEDAGGQVTQLADIVRPTELIHQIEADPADNRVLEAALAGGADFIISGDHHLIDLKEWRGIPIRNPASFLQSNEFA